MRYYVKTKPKASRDGIEKVDENHLVVSVTAMPFKGEANDGLVKLLAAYLKVPKSRILIVAGHKSRQKIIEVY